MEFGTVIHCAHRMNHNNVSDPLTFHLPQPSGQTFHLSSKIFQHLPEGLEQSLSKMSQQQLEGLAGTLVLTSMFTTG